MAFAELEPFGALRDNIHAGIVAATVANANRDTKRRPEPFSPQDFLIEDIEDIDDGDDAVKQNWESQLAIVEMLNTAFGGTDRRDL